MKAPTKNLGFVITALGAALLALPAHSQTFTGGAGLDINGNYDYNVGGNWTGGAVPNTANGGHAVINNGLTASWYGGGDGGDFIIANGGELEVANGTWQQVVNNNWIQLQGNATLLVDGGTFNQGTAGNTPFNIANTGNVFTITSGAANFNGSLASTGAGVTYNFNGGVTTFTGEIDYNTNNNIFVDGGTVNATLVTAVNNAGNGILTIEAGRLNLSSTFGIYAASATGPVNFTLGSTGTIDFQAVDPTTVAGFLSSGAITYNGAINSTAFNIISDGGAGTLLEAIAAPEPSTYVMFGLGLSVLLFAMRRRAARVRI